MPTYSIAGPDGKTYSIDGPEGATREQVIAKIQERQKSAPQERSLLGNALKPIGDIPGDIGSEFMAGSREAGEGLQEIFGDRPYQPGEAGRKILGGGLREAFSPVTGAIKALYGDPVRANVPGKVGEATAQAGEFALPMLIPGGVGVKAAEKFEEGATSILARARKAGYVFPPEMTKQSGPVASGLETLGGKLKTRQEASIRNQQVKNDEGAKFIGLPKDTKLTEQVFTDALAKEGKAYEAVKNVPIRVPVDDDALNEIVNLGGSRSAAAQEFKDLLHNPDIEKLKDQLLEQTNYSPEALVEAVKQLRAWSRVNFRAGAMNGDPGKSALAFAQKESAQILDRMMERRLEATGYENLVPAYREARIKIAKIHDLESVTDAAGNVDSGAVAALADRKMLTGELSLMAETHRAFTKGMGKEALQGGVAPYSLFDATAAFGGLTTMASGHPIIGAGEIAAVGARPLARRAALSDRVQNTLAGRAETAATKALSRQNDAFGALQDQNAPP